MRFLLVNDDGIDNPGLAASVALMERFGEVTVVAPATEQSGTSHQATHHHPLRVTERGPRQYAVQGYPVDCVRLGLHSFCKDADWVIAGINPGGNLGADVYHSGTVAAAREAALHGRGGLALSQLMKPQFAMDWPLITERLVPLVEEILQHDPQDPVYWNLNLPCPAPDAPLPALRTVPVDPMPYDLRYSTDDDAFTWRGVYRDRPRTEGNDFATCLNGHPTLSRIAL